MFLTNIIYTSVNINFLSTIRLIRKYIKIYLEVTLISNILVNNGDIFRYIDIKNKLYYLRDLDVNPRPKEIQIYNLLYNDDDNILEQSKYKIEDSLDSISKVGVTLESYIL